MHLIQRMNEAATQIHRPDTIDDGTSKKLVVSRLQGNLHEFGPRTERRYGRWPCLVVLSLLFDFFVLLLLFFRTYLNHGFFNGCASEEHQLGDLVFAFGRLEFHFATEFLGDPILLGDIGPLEERCHSEIVILLPVLDQGMVMTLGTAHVDAEKDRTGVVGQFIQFLGSHPDECSRTFGFGIVLVANQHVTEHQVPGPVLTGGLQQVFPPFPRGAILPEHQKSV